MNILFDLISTQSALGGGGTEYTRRVFLSLLDRTKKLRDLHIFGIIDSSIGTFPYPDLSPDYLSHIGVTIEDAKELSISEIVARHHIDKIFIGILQLWAKRYSLDNVNCEIITTIHDLHDEEMDNIQLYSYLSLFKSPYYIIRRLIVSILNSFKKHKNRERTPLSRMIKSLSINPKWTVITPSEYSKSAFLYFYPLTTNNIKVLYSPERIMKCDGAIEDPLLRELINSRKKYYLLVSADRPEKNAKKALNAFKEYRRSFLKGEKDLPYIVTSGYPKQEFKGHINLPYLSERDLVYAYKNCYALIYPSFFEGFGYPPVEAMQFGKPILASNVTSIPEILGTAPIYFSPYYESGIFGALCQLNNENYNEYANRSLERYAFINKRQEADLNELIDIITTQLSNDVTRAL